MTDRRLRLLCLDGGGVRGLASLFLLRQLLAQVGNPRPCDFFDMICGTSTGGLIAIMLGRLEMNIDDCIDAFTAMMDEIFKRKRIIPLNLTGSVQPRYDTDVLEKCIKQVISEAGFEPDAKLRGPKESSCKIFVVALTGEARSIVRFTDYAKSNGEQSIYNDVKIWEAARATSAATSFFSPVVIRSKDAPREFLDGGLGANNPLDELWLEAREVWGPGPLEPQIRCLLSIGTGKPPLESFGKSLVKVGKSIIAIAAETEKTYQKFHNYHVELFNQNIAFRFNPPDISEVGLEDASKRGIIATRTEAYGEDVETRRRFDLFRQSIGEEPSLEPRVIPKLISKLTPSTWSYPFYSLTRSHKYISPNANSYWRHLTVSSWEIYETIHSQCADHKGRVHFSRFCAQFVGQKPSPRTIAKVWCRLLINPSDFENSLHPKGFAMACLYMLHVEKYLPKKEKPLNNDKTVGVTTERRELLKRFGNWVQCQCGCQCGLEWNFGNDVGLHRQGDMRKCAIMALFNKQSVMKISIEKESTLWKLTRKKWEESVM